MDNLIIHRVMDWKRWFYTSLELNFVQ